MKVTRRHLPHIYVVGAPLFVTFRLHGSLPPGRHFDRGSLTSGQAFVVLDRLLEREICGPLYFKIPEIAEIVQNEILTSDGFSLHAWVIMPNHVHLLITPRRDVATVMQGIKGRTARIANQALGRQGHPFWQHESYDRLVRDDREFQRIERYILDNPTRAGIVSDPGQYPWLGRRS